MFCKNSLFPVLLTLCLLSKFPVQLPFVYVNTYSSKHVLIGPTNVYCVLMTCQVLCRL